MTKITDKQQNKQTINPNSLKNLKPRFKKGVSGNPNGRPKKENCIPDILNRLGDEKVIITEGKNKGLTITKRDFILRGVYSKAMKGDQWSIQFIADRTEGKPFITSNITLTDKDSPLAGFRELYKKNVEKNLKAEKSD